MGQTKTFWGAVSVFLMGIGSSIRYKGLWRSILWLCWLALTIISVSAVFGSLAEYEARAASGYAIVSIVLLAIGIWALISRRSRVEAH